MSSQAPYHVIPDRIKGGWNVYTTSAPQEPQVHFDTKDEAVAYAEQASQAEGLDYVVQEEEIDITR